jgi:hypothetical protein
MRIPPTLVVFGAVAFKLWLFCRMLTPQQIIILKIAGFALVVLMLTIMGMPKEEKRSQEIGEPFCSDRPQRRMDYDFEYCEFKLRDVRLGHSVPMRRLIA